LNLEKTTFLNDQFHEIVVNDTPSVFEKAPCFLCKIQGKHGSFSETELVFLYKDISKNVQKFKNGLKHSGVKSPVWNIRSTLSFVEVCALECYNFDALKHAGHNEYDLVDSTNCTCSIPRA